MDYSKGRTETCRQAKTLVGSHPVFTFSVTSGGSAVSQFGGDVTVSVPYTPASGENLNAIVIYYIAANGTPKLVPDAHYDAASGTVSFTTTHFSTYAVGYNKVSFTDVASGAWYADAVSFLSARGITSGTTATTFSPDATLTCGQFITMLLWAYGIVAVTSPTDNFSDAGSTYYTGYLAAAKKLGITSGAGNNKFALLAPARTHLWETGKNGNLRLGPRVSGLACQGRISGVTPVSYRSCSAKHPISSLPAKPCKNRAE